MEDSVIIDQISRAQALAVGGDREGARALYEAFWVEAIHAGNQYRACVIAHFMAHAQADAGAQLDWHLRALRAADGVGGERVRAFYPSLHANLGDVYLRLGNFQRAKEHINRAREVEQVLTDDGYGHMIRSLIVRLSQALEHDDSHC